MGFRRGRLTFVPHSLKKTEQIIIRELAKSGAKVNFSIEDYNIEKKTVEYCLANASGSKDVPVEAQEIVKKHLERWKATFSP